MSTEPGLLVGNESLFAGKNELTQSCFLKIKFKAYDGPDISGMQYIGETIFLLKKLSHLFLAFVG